MYIIWYTFLNFEIIMWGNGWCKINNSEWNNHGMHVEIEKSPFSNENATKKNWIEDHLFDQIKKN